jgi:gamma-glutamyltranspeptidase / glutathione hydrolase
MPIDAATSRRRGRAGRAPGILAGLVVVALVGSAPLAAARDRARGEAARGRPVDRALRRPAGGVVAAENPLAAEVGARVLRDGGSAVDAAIATALAACVVVPSSCGLGGGGFLVLWDPVARRARALDFRETAPAALREELFERDGSTVPERSRRGGLAVGVPGEIAGLAAAHRRYGRLPWDRLVEPAARLARDGFPATEHLAKQIAANATAIAADPTLAAIFLDGHGRPPAAGSIVRNPDLADTLDAIATRGPSAFYRGRVARALARAARERGGVLSEHDLVAYRPLWREPLVVPYRGAIVYTMPPPSGGGPALVAALRTLERYDVAALGVDSPTRWQLYAEILKHAFADRARLAGDPGFGAPLRRSPGAVPAGRLTASATHPPSFYGTDAAPPADSGTSHVSVLCADGSAAALTTTLNTAFGALVGVPGTGIVLNDEIDDFSFQAPNAFGLAPGRVNHLAPGKRPTSSMTPTIALRDGRPVVAVGASGGPLIVSATLEVLTNVLDFGLAAEAAVASPRIHHQWQPDVLLVEPTVRAVDRAALERVGHSLREIRSVAAASLATSGAAGFSGAGDARKGGAARNAEDLPPPAPTRAPGAGGNP